MATTQRAKILCVDDERRVLDSMRVVLEQRYQVFSALNGAEGVEILRQEPNLAAIISDMHMPGMDGATFLARARALVPNAGRILLTGEASLQSAIAAVNEAQILKFLIKPCLPHELLTAVEAAITHYRHSGMENTGLRRAITAQVVGRDQVTGLASRARFIETLEGVCPDADGKDAAHSYAVLFIDIENLRDINAAQGHTDGDQALQTLGQRLVEHCTGALCIARWGDEEFAVLLPGDFTNKAAVLADAEALIAHLAVPMVLGQSAQRLRACVGIVGLPVHTGDAKTAIKFAGIAARQAKQQGSIACLFRSDWAQRIEYRHRLLASLREAIENDALHMHYQPIIDLQHGTVRAFEALVRWNHPVLGPISSAQFVTLAEESGDMPRLGHWILRRACREARQLAGRYCARVAVNVSVQQLLRDGFLTQLDDALRLAHLHPQELEIELTESVLASDAERSLSMLIELRKRGVAVAIDDFGTGYSSLAYLQRFPADTIKVDRSFVTTFGQGGEAIISAALSIGRSFGMEVVIEGVESEATRRQLSALGATLFQGYLYSQPMSAQHVEQWFSSSGFTAAPSQVPARPRNDESAEASITAVSARP